MEEAYADPAYFYCEKCDEEYALYDNKRMGYL